MYSDKQMASSELRNSLFQRCICFFFFHTQHIGEGIIPIMQYLLNSDMKKVNSHKYAFVKRLAYLFLIYTKTIK